MMNSRIIKKPKITVLMSVYNGKQYISQAIESVLGQTFKNIEIIIVNDGSTDGTHKIMEQYEQYKILFIHNEKNEGLTKSLNKGLKYARGDYIARMDADDIAYPQRLAMQNDFLDKHPQIGVLGSAVHLINEKGLVTGCYIPPTEDSILRTWLILTNVFRHPTLLIRKKLLDQINGYNENYAYAADYDLLLRISALTCLAILPEILLQYRIYAASMTNKYRLQQLDSASKISYQNISKIFGRCNIELYTFEKFWFDYYRMPFIKSLSASDICKLNFLWDFLALDSLKRDIWGKELYGLAMRCLRSFRLWTAYELFKMIHCKFYNKIKQK